MIDANPSAKELAGEGAFIWLGKAREWERQTGKKAIHFEIGEPDFQTPQNIVEAAVKALHGGKTKYTPSNGIRELREAVAEYLGKKRGITIDPDCVVIGPGAKPLINALFQTIIDHTKPNTALITPDPGYGPYIDNAKYYGAKIYRVPMEEKNDWRYDVKVLRDVVESVPAGMDKVLLTISPSNPTGGILKKEDWDVVEELAKKHDMLVVSDEIYDDFVFEGGHTSILSRDGMMERTVLIHGASKTWAMTGWRLGWGVFPKHLAPTVGKMMGNIASCTAEFTQYAGIEAVRGPQEEVAKMKAEYKARRDYCVKAFKDMGCYCSLPGGSFYAYPNIRKIMDARGFKSELDLCNALLQEKGVVCLPGPAFGPSGKDHIRLSLVSSMDDLKEGMKRIKEFAGF